MFKFLLNVELESENPLFILRAGRFSLALSFLMDHCLSCTVKAAGDGTGPDASVTQGGHE